jgi:putative nucleotidyltransferase with HDIG domain
MAQSPSRRRSETALNKYVLLVACLGSAAVLTSLIDLAHQGVDYRNQWLSLVVLTIVSGLLPVSLPSINVSVSTSETFVIAGTILFGQAGGTLLVLLDALFISLYLFFAKGLRWQQILFNVTSTPLSVWIAAELTHIEPLFRTEGSFGSDFLLQLGLFCTLHFLINTFLLAYALALHTRVRVVSLWWSHFRELLVNFAAGGSIAALLVYNTREVQPEFVFAIIPLLFVLFLTYRWSNRRVEVERERNNELSRVFMSTIEALALAIDAKDQVTHGHIRRVQRYTLALADALGIRDRSELDAIRAAALLHDTGKLAVPEYILNKPGPLTASEFERMKVHADVGADILKSIDFPYPVEPIVRHHHEQWDGRGYPAGLRGQEIPIGARILSVVDCYDALTSDRPYRPRMTRPQAEQVLRDRRGKTYDPWIVDQFLAILDELEALDAAERRATADSMAGDLRPNQLDVIAATTAEEREFGELRRDLSRAPDLAAAIEVLLRHIKRIVPAETLAFCMPQVESNELAVAVCSGVGAGTITGMRVDVGERISGWSFAHSQFVLNSDATLELGPVARALPTPLRYATAVPVIDRKAAAIIMVYSSEPLERDHGRLLESAAALFAASVPEPFVDQPKRLPPLFPVDPAKPSVH